MSCDTLYLSHVYEQTKNINGKQFYYNVIHYGYFYFAFNTMYFFKICPYFKWKIMLYSKVYIH